MSTTQTTNIGLTKPTPGTGEYPNVSVINANMDIIDAAVGAVDVAQDGDLQTQVAALRDSVDTLENSVIVDNLHHVKFYWTPGTFAIEMTVPSGTGTRTLAITDTNLKLYSGGLDGTVLWTK